MGQGERLREKETVLENLRVIRVGSRQHALLSELAEIYFETWYEEGLCDTYEEAFSKMEAFDPENTFAVVDEDEFVYALVQTLPVNLPLARIPHDFPTYASVEAASASRQTTVDPNFLICFSINVLPGFRVKSPSGSISLARFLLSNLPVPEGANRVAYSRFNQVEPGITIFAHYQKNLYNPNRRGPAWMHEGLGGLIAATIEQARPEDFLGGGGNAIVVYPKNDEQRDAFETARAERLLHFPPTCAQGNIVTFDDVVLT